MISDRRVFVEAMEEADKRDAARSGTQRDRNYIDIILVDLRINGQNLPFGSRYQTLVTCHADRGYLKNFSNRVSPTFPGLLSKVHEAICVADSYKINMEYPKLLLIDSYDSFTYK